MWNALRIPIDDLILWDLPQKITVDIEENAYPQKYSTKSNLYIKKWKTSAFKARVMMSIKQLKTNEVEKIV